MRLPGWKIYYWQKHTKAMAEVLTRIEGAIAAEFKDRPSYKSMMVRAGKATHSVKAGSLPIVSVQLDEEWQLKPAIEAGRRRLFSAVTAYSVSRTI